ncbi:MAG TPA: cytochrome c [Bryobacteraceae bacterium]|nr:cytochrome c [Bryobacteraceae bacterium]
MKRMMLLLAVSAAAQAHDIITTAITWDREISRLVFTHCASCHHPGGMAFSLLTYKEARPWAEAIKEEVLARRMPPWGAIKGFGDFRNDQALTPEEIEIVVSWADGGVPEGEDKDLPPLPKLDAVAASEPFGGDFILEGNVTLPKPLRVDGLWPSSAPEQGSFQIVALLPDGSVEPMLWLQDYKPQFSHPFLFRKPLNLPAGTVIQGVPDGARIALLMPAPKAQSEQPKTARNTP